MSGKAERPGPVIPPGGMPMDEQNVGFDPLEAVTVREAAELLHVSRPTLEKYIKAGELPSIVIGRCRRIRRADLETFMAEHTGHGWRRTNDPGRADAACAQGGAANGGDDDWEGDDIPF